MESMKEKENSEAEIVSLKTKLHTKYIGQIYENNSKILEQIIINQNPFSEKISIEYKQNTNEDSSSITTGNEEKPRIYLDVIKDPLMKKRPNANKNNNSSSEDSENDSDSDSDNDSEPQKVLFMEININEVLNSDE